MLHKTMKMLSCRDAGLDCNFVARGETADEVTQKAARHLRSAHPEKWEEMNGSGMNQGEMKNMMTPLIKETVEVK